MRVLRFVRRHKKLLIFLVIIIAAGGYFLFPKTKNDVSTETITKGDIVEVLSSSGNIDSSTTVNLSFVAGGKVVYLGVKKGDMITAGQVIATLDQRTTQKNLETALRNYSLQRNTYDTTKENNQNRTPQDALNVTMKRVLENNQYDLEKAVISVELQQLARENSVLTTPISGIVTRSDIPAAGLNVGLTSIVTVVDPKSLVFKMEVDEAEIGKIRDDLPMRVVLNAFPEDPLDLRISSIDFTTHKTSTGGDAYYVEASMPESTLTYRVGMVGDAEIKLNEKKNVVKVPLSSVLDGYVYIKTEKGFEKRKVITGLENDTEAEVVEGLSVGDMVAIDPSEAEKKVKK